MKRILVIMSQPPGCSGVQGLIYNKLLPHLESCGWEFHFAGPSPRLISVLQEPLCIPPDRLHYTDSISPSRRFSVRKQRHHSGSPAHLWWGFLQLGARWLERLLSHDGGANLRRGLGRVVEAAEQRCSFDLIAGKTPDFSVLELAGALAARLDKPFVALVDDPHGYRDASGFCPAEPEKQQALLSQCCGALFMSPLTRRRYVEAALVNGDKAWAISDCYPMASHLYESGRSPLAATPPTLGGHLPPLRLLHLGNLAEWRPLEPFLDSLEAFQGEGCDPSRRFALDLVGYVYPAARQRIQASRLLRRDVRMWPAVPYDRSHWLAEDADIQFVVIGPRHVDNQPSKFFEYLGHRKPLLVIGPPGNPIQALVGELGIGLYADVSSSEAIHTALQQLAHDRVPFIAAYGRRREAIERFSAHSVAMDWVRFLNTLHTLVSARAQSNHATPAPG